MDALNGATFLSGANAEFIAELYGRYLENPDAVDEGWREFFAEFHEDPNAVRAERAGPPWAKPLSPFNGETGPAPTSAKAAHPASAEGIREAAGASIRALQLIRAYRVRGHLLADLDPLGLEQRGHHPELDYRTYGFAEADLDREIFINNLGRERATLREIMGLLREIYCGHVGIEYMHIQVLEERQWIQQKFEHRDGRPSLTGAAKKEILRVLTEAETFERFLDRRYTGTKRFGIEGAESLMPALEAILRCGAELGVKEFVLGMPHRGRLNVLANFMCKPYAAIFSEFQGNAANPEHVQGSGDVKYHLGTSGDRNIGGRNVHLSLAANPSHLEAVNPVVLGKVRAKQRQRGDRERKEVVAILMHGDAAFAGQGVVAESLELSDLRGYRTGGTVHIIVNNQIGFTTSPTFARSSPYPSDVAKGVQAPIFHVNGDDPEAVTFACKMAIEFRQRFHRDIVIDMWCYRRFGHNEGDEPGFTQPLMYDRIRAHPPVSEVYGKRLIEQGVVDRAWIDDNITQFTTLLEGEFEAGAAYKPNKADWFAGRWSGLHAPADTESARRSVDTGIESKLFDSIGRTLTTVPDDLTIHKTLARVIDAKREMFKSGANFDWATGEALAYGSLLSEGYGVRLSGQDSGRGTFSQRHAVWVDQKDEHKYLPLA